MPPASGQNPRANLRLDENMRTTILPLALLLPSVALIGCVGDPEQESFQDWLEEMDWPIVGGQTTNGWDSVVMLGLNDSICTATVVSPDVILTAAHCLEGQWGSLDVYWCNDCYGQGYWDHTTSNDYEQHPHYNPNTMAGDLGVVLLNGNSPSEPVPINRDAAGNTWLGNQHPLTSVGFGVTAGHLENSGTKREVTVAATSWDGTFLYYEDPNHGICFGDSGGPAMTSHDGGWKVAGVHSWVSGNCDDIGASIRVDTYQSWVDDFTGEWTPDDDDDDTGDDDTGDDDTGPSDDDTDPSDDDTGPGDDDTGPGDDDTWPGDDDTEPPHDDLPAPHTSGRYDMPDGVTCLGSLAPAATGNRWATAAAVLTLGLAALRRRSR